MTQSPCPAPRSFFLGLLFTLGLSAAFAAEAARPGAIAGRVQNADTGEFLYNAQVRVEAGGQFSAATATDQFGAYRLENVPGGEATLRAVYSGLPAMTLKVTVTPGQRIVPFPM